MKTLKKFKEFIEKITADNSRNYKLSILKQYKNDEDIRYILKYVYDPYIVTGISDKKLKRANTLSSLDTITVFDKEDMTKNLLDYIKEHKTGTDDVLIMYATNRNQLDDEYAKLLDKIVTKDLQLGVDVKSINKEMPKLIREFNVQLANKYFDDPSKVIGKEFCLTTKIDGMRCIMLYDEDDTVTFWSRQGQQIEGLVDLSKEVKALFTKGTCLDGELIAKETSKEETYKNTMKLARTKDVEKHNLKMMVFDYMSVKEFKNQSCQTIYKDRRDKLDSLFKDKKPEYFELLPVLYKGRDPEQIIKWLNHNVSKGEEGVMINISDGTYEFKRTNNLLKVKLMKDLDLRVVDYFEGEGTFTGTLGGFIVSYKGNEVKVGSGYDQDFREAAWKHPKDFIGKIISVQYFEETTNANGGLSLRFPVFLDIRDDKTEPDF